MLLWTRCDWAFKRQFHAYNGLASLFTSDADITVMQQYYIACDRQAYSNSSSLTIDRFCSEIWVKNARDILRIYAAAIISYFELDSISGQSKSR